MSHGNLKGSSNFFSELAVPVLLHMSDTRTHLHREDSSSADSYWDISNDITITQVGFNDLCVHTLQYGTKVYYKDIPGISVLVGL